MSPSDRIVGGDAAARTDPASPSLFSKAIFLIDRQLQSHGGVFCYSSDPKCVFRISLTTLQSPAMLDWWTTLPAGATIAELHLWNEQIPLASEYDSAIAWALAFGRSFALSLRLLSAYLAENPQLHGVQAIRGDMALGAPEMTERLLGITGRLGFRPCGGHDGGGAGLARRIGENILISMMILARNAGEFRFSTLRRTRVLVFMPREVLDRRYGARDRTPGPQS
jgi:hypothetical protein